jgi:hypothetical protein
MTGPRPGRADGPFTCDCCHRAFLTGAPRIALIASWRMVADVLCAGCYGKIVRWAWTGGIRTLEEEIKPA